MVVSLLLSPNVTLVKLVQSSKAYEPILVTLSGMMMLVRVVSLTPVIVQVVVVLVNSKFCISALISHIAVYVTSFAGIVKI